MSKLNLDRDKTDLVKKTADQITSVVLKNVERYTSPGVERAVLRFLGVEGPALKKKPADLQGEAYPLVNELIELIGWENLTLGAGYWLGLAALHHPQLTATQLARKIVSGEILLQNLEKAPIEKIHQAAQNLAKPAIQKLREANEKKKKRPDWAKMRESLRYLAIGTGNLQEDIWQAQAAVEIGADIIAMMRSSGQSLLDYVPEGETLSGNSGTDANQSNLQKMRQALDQSEKKLKRRVGLTFEISGLCAPELAMIAALEGADYLVSDTVYPVLLRDINMKRSFVDQHFARRIAALSEIGLQVGEDSAMASLEPHKHWYQELVIHFIEHSLARRAGLSESAITLTHAFEIAPSIEDFVLLECSQAQLIRELFPKSLTKFMPPTQNKSEDVFLAYLYDGLFNLLSRLTQQNIQVMGMHSSAILRSSIQDFYFSFKNTNYLSHGAKSIGDELEFQANGKIARNARQILDDALKLLKKITERGLLISLSEGAFAGLRRSLDGGVGGETVIEKHKDYYSPLRDYFLPAQKLSEEKILERRYSSGSRYAGSENAPSQKEEPRRSERSERSDKSERSERSRKRGRRRPDDRRRAPKTEQQPAEVKVEATPSVEVPVVAENIKVEVAEVESAESAILLSPPALAESPVTTAPSLEMSEAPSHESSESAEPAPETEQAGPSRPRRSRRSRGRGQRSGPPLRRPAKRRELKTSESHSNGENDVSDASGATESASHARPEAASETTQDSSHEGQD